MTNWTKIRTQLGNRSAIIGVGVAGFLVGAGGFAAAQSDDSPSAEVETEVEVEAEVEAEVETESTVDAAPTEVATASSTAAGASTEVTTASSTAAAVTVPDPGVPTSVDLTVPAVTIDDSTSTSSSSVTTNTIDSTSSSSVPTNTIDDHGDDDSTSSSVPTNTIDDSSSSSSSVPVALPAAFTRSYQSLGGSIEVTWTGTAFVLESVSPAPGFRAEIEDQAWDRIRVDFDGDDDARIEVRLNDGQIRVRVD